MVLEKFLSLSSRVRILKYYSHEEARRRKGFGPINVSAFNRLQHRPDQGFETLKSELVCSLLGTKKGDTLEFPVVLGKDASGRRLFLLLVAGSRVWAEPHSGDQVLIVTLWILVDGAAVVCSLGMLLLLATAGCGARIGLRRR